MISIFLDFTTTRFFCKGTANGSQNPIHKNFCNIVAILRKKRVTLPLAMGRKLNLDIVGIGASLACAIHCAILPLFLNSLPLFGMNIIENQAFEYSMIALTFIIGGISLFHGYKKHHHSRMPFMIFSLGIIFLISKQIWHHWQYYFLPVAVLLIVWAHLLNYKSCRLHNHAHSDDCNH